ncbi:unnamed protein product [Ilex paraguariensis]|uniref:Uncharacterized protein n=1 Tax=Ilex paraguariensis TaxID=185542 RepID=A0ABC8T9H2_9AQUA
MYSALSNRTAILRKWFAHSQSSKSYIVGCENPLSFPSQSQSFTHLKELSMTACQRLESFPDINLPRNLETLSICNCRELKPLSEWGLHRLPSLQRFTMRRVYPELLSFPDSCFLPDILKFLCIDGFSNLESLSKGLQNLTSLETLEIMNCPELGLLPNEGTLATLSSLAIVACPLLERRGLVAQVRSEDEDDDRDHPDSFSQIDHEVCFKEQLYRLTTSH